MKKYSFLDDYSEGCHNNILIALQQTNLEQNKTYGFDKYSEQARELLREKIGRKSSIFFLSGGTQANLVVISALLASHEGVISSQLGHILGNEAGALEATGHKIISSFSEDGKLKVKNLEKVFKEYSFFPHRIRPKLVYLSNATEIGTIYTKNELKTLHDFCQTHNLLLFIDGARLGHALSSKDSDLSLKDLANLSDVFTIGGTKNGALFGEAIVINNDFFAQDFIIHMKQRGALLAKGKVLGIQFLELFKDNLYFDLAKRANDLAQKLADGFENKGYKTNNQIQTNQIFITLPNNLINKLKEKFDFYIWEELDEQHSVIRLVTSWASDESKIDKLISII